MHVSPKISVLITKKNNYFLYFNFNSLGQANACLLVTFFLVFKFYRYGEKKDF